MGLALVVGGVVGLQIYNESRESYTVKSEMHDLVKKLPSYATDKDYVEKVFNASHKSAFEAACPRTGLLTSGAFDDRQYLTLVIDNMITRAKADGKEPLVGELEGIKVLLTSQDKPKG